MTISKYYRTVLLVAATIRTSTQINDTVATAVAGVTTATVAVAVAAVVAAAAAATATTAAATATATTAAEAMTEAGRTPPAPPQAMIKRIILF